MASIDQQKFSPLLEKRNFKDLLEDEIVTVEEDLITKIFSQTVQVSPSEETSGIIEIAEDHDTNGLDSEVQEQIEEAEDVAYDKVPADFTHFNTTIVDLDEVEDDIDMEAVHINTPSTASPVDEQSEIRDFEEIERITLDEASEEAEVEDVQEINDLEMADEVVEESEDICGKMNAEESATEDDADCHLQRVRQQFDAEGLTAMTRDHDSDEDQTKDSDLDIVSNEGVVQTESRKTVTTKIVTSSMTTTVQGESSSAIVGMEMGTEDASFPKKKSLKKKKGRAAEKENISVVPPTQSTTTSTTTTAVPYPPPAQLGIFCSVRELSKLYEEKQLISRPRRPFIKEDIMQITLNVKNMCRSFLDLTQYTTTTMATMMNEKQSPPYRPHNGSLEKKLFQKSKSITDLRRSIPISHYYHQHQYTGFEQSNKGGGGNGVPQISRQFSSSVFFLKKLLFFENWRRCGREAEDDNTACKQVHCPHCFSLKSDVPKGSLPPKKIRISIMQFDMKSSFSKFDALQKKAAAAAAAQPHANGSPGGVAGILGQEKNSVMCTSCEKVVYQMEQMKAENRYWHKNCFRCTSCNKPLSVDTYQSHEAILYCKPHFKQLFSPKTVVDTENEEVNQNRGPEMIIRESQPTALPEGVVRATDKVEDGLSLDDLHRLKNVKQAFEMFEKVQQRDSDTKELSTHKVEKSPSIINKLAQFQKKISRESGRSRRKGVPADDLNGEPQEGNMSDSSSCYTSDDEPPEGADVDLWRSRKAIQKSDPIPHCTDLDDLKKKFEGNNAEVERRERQEERREEIKRIRSRLFMGKQAKIKEQYQQAVLDSEFVPNSETENGNAVGVVPGNIKDKMQQLGDEPQAVNTTKQKLMEMKSENQMELEELRRQKQRDNLEIKSKFESGPDKSPSYRGADDPELMAQMVDRGIAKMSRNIFLEIDKQAQQSGPMSPILQPQVLRKSTSLAQVQTPPVEVVNKSEENGGGDGGGVVIDTKDLQKKFAFFEKYQEQDRSPKKTINVSKFKDTTAVKEMFENNQLADQNKRESTNEGHDVAANTTKRMLNIFRDIESGASNKQREDGPRPLKAFTPPPDGGRRLYDNGNENEDPENEGSPGVTDNSDIESEDEEVLKKRIGKYDDEILERAKQEARAQKLRAKFEKWETEQIKLEQQADQGVRREYLAEIRNSNEVPQNGEQIDGNQLESATNLRQKFEFMSKGDLSQANSPRKVMVNRFV